MNQVARIIWPKKYHLNKIGIEMDFWNGIWWCKCLRFSSSIISQMFSWTWSRNSQGSHWMIHNLTDLHQELGSNPAGSTRAQDSQNKVGQTFEAELISAEFLLILGWYSVFEFSQESVVVHKERKTYWKTSFYYHSFLALCLLSTF